MNPTTIAEMQAKAAELRANYPGQSVLVGVSICAYHFKEEIELEYRMHVMEQSDKGLDRSVQIGSDWSAMEAALHKELDPAIKHQRALARAEKLEAEAAALRASVGGAA